ncbi:MAG: hypothetical protein ACTSPI_08515 [Candidatus Heimdallarchaeaceae archaeon]
MINVKDSVIRDAEKPVNVDALLVKGRPVSINEDGEIIAADNTTGCYGLSLTDKNPKRDDTYGEVGAYGSRKATVEVAGRVEVSPSSYLDSDLNEEVVYQVYDVEQDYVPMQKIYVNAEGLLTNQDTGNEVGILTKAPTANDPVMELIVKCA